MARTKSSKKPGATPAPDLRDIKTPGVADRLNAERPTEPGAFTPLAEPIPAIIQPPTYTIHPVALKFPPIPANEFAQLKESIRQHGQFQPIVLSEGKVLDGRHRYEICLELGIEPKTINFSEIGVNLTVEEFIFDSNMKRRHLTESQRAAIAAEFANMRQGERTDLTPSDNCPKVSQQKAGELLKVSSKSVSRAKKVKEKDPATFAKVKSGDVSLNAAVEAVKANETKAEISESEPVPVTKPTSSPSPDDQGRMEAELARTSNFKFCPECGGRLTKAGRMFMARKALGLPPGGY